MLTGSHRDFKFWAAGGPLRREADRHAAWSQQHAVSAALRGGPSPPADRGGHRQREPGVHVHLVDALVLGFKCFLATLD